MKQLCAQTRFTLALASSFSLCVFCLLGCSEGLTSRMSTPVPVLPTITLKGHVHGGQQPISGAVIQLYAAGITGLKSAATPLIVSTVTTDPSGSFSINGDWNCTSNTAAYGLNPLLYIVASGGNPGIPGVTNNAAIDMVAALGPCDTINSSTNISLDEMTTVAAAYALAPFMSDVGHVGASGSNATGLVDAFNNASLLVNWSTGVSPGNLLPATATAPVAELNSLGDILASCVDSSGSDGACSALFAAATPTGGTAPTEIVGVILNIASNPALPAATLYSLMESTPPFVPQLSSAPHDWTMAVNFAGGGLSAPVALAIDASSNVWVANAGGSGVTELSPTGTPITGSTGFNAGGALLGAQGIAVDQAGNVWVADTLLSSVAKLTVSNGVIQSSSSFTSGGISGPVGIAIDSQNDVWIANSAGGSVTELNHTGAVVGASPLSAGGTLQSPTGVAVDSAGNVWVTDKLASDVVEFSNSQSLLSGAGNTDSAIFAPQGIAIDAAGRAWVAYQGTNAVSYYANSLNAVTPSPYTGGGLSVPTAVAIDGAGGIWITNNQTAGSLTKLAVAQSTPLSPATGLGVLNAPAGIAIDAAGSVWTANAGDNTVSEFIGLTAPATVPLGSNAGP